VISSDSPNGLLAYLQDDAVHKDKSLCLNAQGQLGLLANGRNYWKLLFVEFIPCCAADSFIYRIIRG